MLRVVPVFSREMFGGRYFSYDNTNFTYGGGLSVQLNIIGHHNRWDSQFLYTTASPVLALSLGAKYDQRAQERYTAMNARLFYRWANLIGSVESYTKRNLSSNPGKRPTT